MAPSSSAAKTNVVRALRLDYDPRADPHDPAVIRGMFDIPPEYDGIVLRCHSSSGVCTVCKTILKHDRDGRKEEVALKIVSKMSTKLNGEELVAREIQAWRALRHARVLPLYGHCTLDTHVVLVSPWMKRGNLLEHIRANPDVDRQELLVQAADGLKYLHDSKGLVHGDIKAENVLITETGDVLLADFGLSTHVEKSAGANTTATDIRGRWTLRFCAPEMLEDDVGSMAPSGHLTVDREPPIAHRLRSKSLKTDVYAFGMLMFQTFTGASPWHGLSDVQVIVRVTKGERPPFQGEAAAVRRGMNRAYWAVCQLCWSKKPEDRPTMGEVWYWLDFHRDSGGNRLLSSSISHESGAQDVEPETVVTSASGKQTWIKKMRQQWELRDGTDHIAWYATHARKSSKASSAGSASEPASPETKVHAPVKFAAPKKAIKKASVVVPAVTRQLWQALREHFELYEGTTDAGYYPYQWRDLASPTSVDDESNAGSITSEPVQIALSPGGDSIAESFLEL
ncbi:kinase-like protein [Auricularia subglabra TFB-10046 SS5]|nr:kinase-like protein [Auricularia subglabra TFB-10046 SS5]